MRPSSFEKMRKLATQLLSKSVAVGLETLMSFNVLPPAAIHTVNFIDLMDKLFDTLNLRSFNRPFSKAKEQMDVLEQALDFFSKVEIIDGHNKTITKRMKFIHG